jgi:hypothetical protein
VTERFLPALERFTAAGVALLPPALVIDVGESQPLEDEWGSPDDAQAAAAADSNYNEAAAADSAHAAAAGSAASASTAVSTAAAAAAPSTAVGTASSLFPFSFRTPLHPLGVALPTSGPPILTAIDGRTSDPLLLRNRLVVSGQPLSGGDVKKSLLSVATALRRHTSDQNRIEWLAAVQGSPSTVVVQLRPAATGRPAVDVRQLVAAARRDISVQSWCAWEAAQLSERFGLAGAHGGRVCPDHFSDVAAPAAGRSLCARGDECALSHDPADLAELCRRREAGLTAGQAALLQSEAAARHRHLGSIGPADPIRNLTLSVTESIDAPTPIRSSG